MKKEKLENLYKTLTECDDPYKIEFSGFEKLIKRLESIKKRFGTDFSFDDSSISFELRDLNVLLNISIYDIYMFEEELFYEKTNKSIDFIEEFLGSGQPVDECINHEDAYEIIDEDFLEDSHYCYWKLNKREFVPSTLEGVFGG